MDALLADLARNWAVYLSMPVIAAVIGWVTKVVAIRMMFQPLEFVGKRPVFGWQGIVPRKAARMAAIACDTMTDKLISPGEVVDRLDPERVVAEIQGPLLAGIAEITEAVADEVRPGLWATLPEPVRQRITEGVRAEAPQLVRELLRLVREDVDGVFDLKGMVVGSLVRDKALLNRIFQEAGRTEFRFIVRSGAVFGFAIGLVQALAWATLKNPWVMPVFGGLTGWFTDWLALKMIFYPTRPKRFLGGLVEWQGMFLRRREQVAQEYGELIAREIITPRNVIDAVLRGPLSDRLFALVERVVRDAVDRQGGPVHPLVVLAVGSTRYHRLKQRVAEITTARLPEALASIEEYAEHAMDIRGTLVQRMRELSDEEFERLIRPAFEQDEWILITVGAVLGFGVGELQVLLVEALAR